MEDNYIYSGTKKLRCGYTTGTCAAAAAQAAGEALLTQQAVSETEILTPKGICRNFPLKDKYVPLSDLSYEFKDNYLAMYFSTKKNNMVKYHIGIKNIKTVKMLADWYPKHDMTNPLLPEGGDNK